MKILDRIERVTNILQDYVSDKIPPKATNILHQLFNGAHAMFVNLEYRLDIAERERNMLTAQHISSLRNLAAQNGYEPSLKVPSKGKLKIQISPKLFNRVGNPLYIKPYSVFTNKKTKLQYIYVGDKPLKINTNNVYVPVIEGTIKSKTFVAQHKTINMFLLDDEFIAENSITVMSGSHTFNQVKSFFDSTKSKDKNFLVKYSNDIQNPICVYVHGLSGSQQVTITWISCNGENGNLNSINQFETESFVDAFGNQISTNDKEVEIINIAGFNYGSNGTDSDSLRAAIGFNHGIHTLFDNISYRNFISKFSNIVIQSIKIDKERKQINYLYLYRKNTVSPENPNLINDYKSVIENKAYLLSEDDKLQLRSILNEHEYCLSSSVIKSPNVCKYAFQIMYESNEEKEKYSQIINKLLYEQFSMFMYNRHHILNVEELFDEFRRQNNIDFSYIIFNELIEKEKIQSNSDVKTPYVIKQELNQDTITNRNYESIQEGPWLPILCGNFEICDYQHNKYQLFFDINHVVKSI